MSLLPISKHSLTSFPHDMLAKCFLNLSLEGLLTVQLVCTVWLKVASSEHIWTQFAYQKGIYLENQSDVRAKVFKSFGPYCTAARLLFPDATRSIPAEANKVYEKVAIDQKISQIEKSAFNLNTIVSQVPSDYLKCRTDYFAIIEVCKEVGAQFDRALFNDLFRNINLSDVDTATLYEHFFNNMQKPDVFIFFTLLTFFLETELKRIKELIVHFLKKDCTADYLKFEKKAISKRIFINKDECYCEYMALQIDLVISLPEKLRTRFNKSSPAFLKVLIKLIESMETRQVLAGLHFESFELYYNIGLLLSFSLRNSILSASNLGLTQKSCL